MASDSEEDWEFDKSTGDSLLDDSAAVVPVRTGEGELKVETDRMRPESLPLDSIARLSHSPHPPLARSYDGELEAKNKTIRALQEKIRQYERRLRMSSSGSGRDVVDGLSPTSPSVLSSLGDSALQGAKSNREISSESEHINSTDAEKLAGYTPINMLEISNERDKLNSELTKAKEEIDNLRIKLSEQERLHQQTRDIKKECDCLYDELEKQYKVAKEQLDSAHAEIDRLRQQLLEQNHEQVKLQQDIARKEEIKLKEQLIKTEKELEDVKREKSSLQARLDEQTVEALSATAYNPGEARVAELQSMIDVLCKDLRDTAITVQQQSEIIRRLKHEAGDMAPRVAEEESRASGFRSRGPSSPESSNLQAPTPASALPRHLEARQAHSEPKSVPSEPRPAPSEPRRAPSEPRFVPSEARRSPVEARRSPVPARHSPVPARHSPVPARRSPVEVNRREVGRTPSTEDLYKPSHPLFASQQLKQSGAFDLDSYHSSLSSLQNRPSTSKTHFPVRETGVRTQPIQRATVEPGESHAYTHPIVPANPPAVSPYPVEHSDSGGVDDIKECPVCGKTQPPGTTMDRFQTHVMDCLAQHDVPDDTSKSNSSGGGGGDTTVSGDRVCPVCSFLHPPSTSQQDFEAHVNSHFDNFTYANQTDSFGTPR